MARGARNRRSLDPGHPNDSQMFERRCDRTALRRDGAAIWLSLYRAGRAHIGRGRTQRNRSENRSPEPQCSERPPAACRSRNAWRWLCRVCRRRTLRRDRRQRRGNQWRRRRVRLSRRHVPHHSRLASRSGRRLPRNGGRSTGGQGLGAGSRRCGRRTHHWCARQVARARCLHAYPWAVAGEHDRRIRGSRAGRRCRWRRVARP